MLEDQTWPDWCEGFCVCVFLFSVSFHLCDIKYSNMDREMEEP